MSVENEKEKNRKIDKIHYVLLGLLLFLIAVIRGVEYLINQEVLKLDENMSFNKFIFQTAESMTKSWIPFTIILLVLFISYVFRQIYNGEKISGKYITALLLAANLLLIGKWYQSENVSRNIEQLKTKWYLFVGLLLLTVLGYFIVLFVKKKKEDDKIIQNAKNDPSNPFAMNYQAKMMEQKNFELEIKSSKKESRRDIAKMRKEIKAAKIETRREKAKAKNEIKVAKAKARKYEAEVKNEIEKAEYDNEKRIKEIKKEKELNFVIKCWKPQNHNKIKHIKHILNKIFYGKFEYGGIIAMLITFVLSIVILGYCYKKDPNNILGVFSGSINKVLGNFPSEGKNLSELLKNVSEASINLLSNFGAIFAVILVFAFIFFAIYFIIRFIFDIIIHTHEDYDSIRKFSRAFKAFFFMTADDLIIILLNLPNFISLCLSVILGNDIIDSKIQQTLGALWHSRKRGRYHNPNGGGNSSTANPMSGNASNTDNNNPNDDSDTTNPNDNDPNN